MKQRLVCLATFDTYSEADLYRSALLARGIQAALAGPDTSGTFGSYFGPLSRVSVMVTEKTARRWKGKLAGLESAASQPGKPNCHSRQPHTPMRPPAGRHSPKNKSAI
jgi:hypothetical protein